MGNISQEAIDVIYRLSKGLPGPALVLSRIFKLGVTPDFLEGYFTSRGIDGEWIWVGFKDVHKQNIHDFIRSMLDETLEKEIKTSAYWKLSHPHPLEGD